MKLAKIVVGFFTFYVYGAEVFASDISTEHLLKLGNLCQTKYNKYDSYTRSSSYGRSSAANMSASYGVMGVGGGFGFSSSNVSSSNNNSVNHEISERDCDKIMSSYFDYLGDNAEANAQRDVGLADADARKQVAISQSEALEKIGVTAAKASERVGVMKAKSSMYQGIAGAAGNVLGSLFSSGNQKEAAKAMAQAEIEKEKIRAATELKKAEMEHEIRMASYQPAQIQNQPYYPQIRSARNNNYEFANNNSTIVQNTQAKPILVSNEYQMPNNTRENHSHRARTYPNQNQLLHSINHQYAAKNSQLATRPQAKSTIQSPRPARNSQYNNIHTIYRERKRDIKPEAPIINPEIAAYAKQNSFILSQNCQQAVIIRLISGESGCFQPKPYLPAGVYTLNASTLIKS